MIVIKDFHLVVYMENVTVEEQCHVLQGPPQILLYNKIKVMLKLVLYQSLHIKHKWKIKLLILSFCFPSTSRRTEEE